MSEADKRSLQTCFEIKKFSVHINHLKNSLVTVLLDAVKAVSVFTSHKNMDLSKPADATISLSLA
uniref:Uncharacterized protein n=1 Tax=Romanomermis culicivorax TaxID=13658 RepID=A0A915K453_ROMCU